jgi:hypothetical protein
VTYVFCLPNSIRRAIGEYSSSSSSNNGFSILFPYQIDFN